MRVQVEQQNVIGLKPVLQALRRLEPTMYRQVERGLKQTAEPVRKGVAESFPDTPWQSSKPVRWTMYGRTKKGKRPEGQAGATFPKYDSKAVRKGVTVKVGGRRRRDGTYPIMSIRQSNAAGQIYDLSQSWHSNAGRQFIKNLRKEGRPSRVMWPRVKALYPMIRADVIKIINDVGVRFSAEIERETQMRSAQSIRARAQSRTSSGRFGRSG